MQQNSPSDILLKANICLRELKFSESDALITDYLSLPSIQINIDFKELITAYHIKTKVKYFQKDYQSAREINNSALKLCEEKVGLDNVDYIDILYDSALIDIRTKMYSSAQEKINRVIAFYSNNFGELSSKLLELRTTNVILSLMMLDMKEVHQRLIDLICLFKDFILGKFENLSANERLMFNDQLYYSEMVIYNLIGKHYREDANLLKALFEFRQIIKRLGVVRKISESFLHYFDDLVAKLSDDQAVIEIIRYHLMDAIGDYREETAYLFLIVTSSHANNPKLIVLENGNEIDNIYAQSYGKRIRNKSLDIYSYKVLWKPVDKMVEEKSEWIISPSGVYRFININSLYDENGKYLIEGHVIYCANNYEHMFDKAQTISAIDKRATLFGNPDFAGLLPEDDNIRNIANGRLAPLDNTEVEIKLISETLNNHGWNTITYLGSEASRRNLLKTEQINVLHIATHGFFRSKSFKLEHIDEALQYSGLFLSDSLMLTDQKDVLFNTNESVLAIDIRDMNLNGTDLVVLSACDTGLGFQIRSGDIFGLQRAFIIAGAKYIICSLWKVPDEATLDLMKSFYKRWMETNDLNESFRKAQTEVKSKYKAPFFWAGFVLMGR